MGTYYSGILIEEELIPLLQKQSQAAFKFLVETYESRIYNTCLGLLQNEADAEDIAQEVFVEVYRSIANFKGEAKLSTWMYRIAVTKSLDHLRSKKRKKRFGFLKPLFGESDNTPRYDPPDFNHPGVLAENKEMAAHLFKALNELPEAQKTAYTLNKIEGMSYQEVAEVMNTTAPSVESLLVRAKSNLRKLLSDYYTQNM